MDIIGFWELTLITIVGLVVLGPKRLPIAIRTLQSWITGVRKFSDTVKAEVTEDLRIHELHTNLKKAEQGGLKNLSPEVAESLRSLKEAAADVTEPFKKMNGIPLDTAMSSIVSMPKQNEIIIDEQEPSLPKTNKKLQNDNVTVEASSNNPPNIESDKVPL